MTKKKDWRTGGGKEILLRRRGRGRDAYALSGVRKKRTSSEEEKRGGKRGNLLSCCRQVKRRSRGRKRRF